MNIQMILALGALILLTLVIMNVNKTSIYTEDVMYDSNYGILATSIGTSIIEEASRMAFDHKTDTVYFDKNQVNQLTPAGSLGTESGENPADPKTFNDFDDFNGFTKIDSTMPSAVFNVSSVVNYVDKLTPNVSTGSQTWHKKITVRISSDYMRDTIIQTSVFSYWNFR